MPVPPQYRHPTSAPDRDDEIGVIYRDPTCPAGVAGYYVVLSLSPRKTLNISLPSECVSDDVWREIEILRHALAQPHSHLQLVG